MKIWDIIKKNFHTLNLRIFVILPFILFLLQEKIKSYLDVDISVIFDFFQNNPIGIIFILLVWLFLQIVEKIFKANIHEDKEYQEIQFWLSSAQIIFIGLAICAIVLHNISKPTQFRKCVKKFEDNTKDDRSKQNFLDSSDKIIQHCKAIYSKE